MLDKSTPDDRIMTENNVFAQDFGSFGIESMAYIKAVSVDGQLVHSIHAADGTPLTVVTGRQLAFATVSQHDMQPMSVH